jgi:hypothetical protein
MFFHLSKETGREERTVECRLVGALFSVVLMLGTRGVDVGGRHRHQTVCDEADLIGAASAACHIDCEALD